MIWVAFAFLAGLACLALLAPLAFGSAESDPAESDRMFYARQIAEIERERAEGRLGAADAEAARVEAARRLLRAGETRGGPAPGGSPTAPNGAAFSTPYNSRGDRASADFDQRQTLVLYSYWQVPRGGSSRFRRVVADLRFSQLAGIRSGFPYSIFTAISSSTLDVINAYARPLDPEHALLAPPQPFTGGERIFNAAAFCLDDTCPNAPLGRNAFAGPGLINLDVSVSRVLHPRWLGEAGGLTFRADAFNFLNHASLNPPGNIPGTAGYGVALFGTPQQTAGFPSLVPLNQTARQIQLLVRISF